MSERAERMASPIIIAHISDLHFGDEDDDKRRELLEELRRIQPDTAPGEPDIAPGRPDMICVTGDLVNLPTRKNFEKARGFLNELGNICGHDKVFVVPGNHDAFFSGLDVRKFCRHLNMPAEFGKLLSVKNISLCVFGINSTYPSLRHLSNSGKVTSKRLQTFRDHVKKIKDTIGDLGYKNAFKIVLLHHHPLPTISNEHEGMLYLRNSGQFINEMAKNNINMILHGHQHDPCDFQLSYNTGGVEEDSMIILSSGTALKKSHEDADLSVSTQHYVVNLHANHGHVREVYINSNHWHTKKKKFYRTKGYIKKIVNDPISFRTLSFKYIIKNNGDLYAEGKATLNAKVGMQIKDYEIFLGVDDLSPEMEYQECNLNVLRGNQSVSREFVKIVRDDPRDKKVEIRLEPPIGIEIETISWSYTWNRGWQRLLTHKIDRGLFTFEPKQIDRLKIQIESQSENFLIEVADIVYADRFSRLSDGFEIENPRKHTIVEYTIRRIDR